MLWTCQWCVGALALMRTLLHTEASRRLMRRKFDLFETLPSVTAPPIYRCFEACKEKSPAFEMPFAGVERHVEGKTTLFRLH